MEGTIEGRMEGVEVTCIPELLCDAVMSLLLLVAVGRGYNSVIALVDGASWGVVRGGRTRDEDFRVEAKRGCFIFVIRIPFPSPGNMDGK